MSVEVAQQNCADVTEKDDFLKVLGHYLSAVFVAAQVLGDSHTRPLVHLLQFPSANLVLPAFSQVTVLKLQDLVKRACLLLKDSYKSSVKYLGTDIQK